MIYKLFPKSSYLVGMCVPLRLLASTVHMVVVDPLSTDEIKQRQSVQQQQQRLAQPIDARAFSCLRDARLYLRGYSELRQVASWLHEALRCRGAGLTAMDECQRAQTPSGSAWPPADSYRNLSACREQLYSRQPYRSSCSVNNVSMHFEWKCVRGSSRTLLCVCKRCRALVRSSAPQQLHVYIDAVDIGRRTPPCRQVSDVERRARSQVPPPRRQGREGSP